MKEYNAKLINDKGYWFVKTDYGTIDLEDNVIEELELIINIFEKLNEEKK
jgi:hypothetical protein